MAKADNTSSEKSLSKDLQIVGYLKSNGESDIREVIDNLDDSKDYLETFTEEKTHRVMMFSDGYKYITEKQYEEALGCVSGPVSVHKFTEEKELHENSTDSYARRIRNDVCEDVEFGNENMGITQRWGNRAKMNDRTVFRVRYDKPKYMGLLKHQSEAEAGDVWEDKEAELPAVMMRVKVDSVSPTVYRWFDNKVIPGIVESLAKHSDIQRHRLMDCEREVKEEGACYDL